jgi:2-isopropylmalate synthase
VLKERTTYEIMDATTVGLEANAIVLGKHSGRHALRQALEELGFTVDGQALNTAFKRFKELADKKKQVTAMDLEALVTDELREDCRATRSSGSTSRPHRAPAARDGRRAPPDGDRGEGSFTGDGPVDAIFRAINAATGVDARLREFRVDAVTGGEDALGEVSRRRRDGGLERRGQGVATDIIEAAGRAYVRALSTAQRRAQRGGEALPPAQPPRELATP